MPQPFLVGITGGTASGKTTLCQEIFKNLKGVHDCVLLSMDNFYYGLSEEDHENADNYNFDHPNSLDFDAMYEALIDLLEYKDVEIPTYDFALHKRTKVTVKVEKSYFILFEGILSLYDERIRDLMDFKIFVTADDDTRLGRRCKYTTRDNDSSVQRYQ